MSEQGKDYGEPWRVIPGNKELAWHGDDIDKPLIWSDSRPSGLQRIFVYNDEICERVVSCVNALAGIPDPEATMREVLSTIKRLMRKVESRSSCDCFGEPPDVWQCEMCQARALLAKLEGK